MHGTIPDVRSRMIEGNGNMRVFDWDDGFTPYSATVHGAVLTERQGDTVERVSRLIRRPVWDDHVNATDNAMADGFASGDVDGVPVAWIDGQAFELDAVAVASAFAGVTA